MKEMKAYIIQNKRKIEPFNEHPHDCLIVNKPLAALQEKVLLDLGLEPIFVSSVSQINEQNEYLVLDDSLYFTRELLNEFIAKSRGQKTITICALKSGITTLRTVTAVQEVKICESHIEYNLRYFPEEKFRGEHCPLIIDPDQFHASIPMPKHICDSEEYLIPLTDRFIIQINHWVNLWAANIVTLLAEGARLQKLPKAKLILLALKARSLNQWKILHQLNRIGRNCDIHPTAYIEGSTIGDNVTIGAGAVIKESAIDSNSFIGNGVVIEESVIGKKNTVLNGHILYSVLYPGTFTVAQFISASLIGRDTFIGINVSLTDFRLDGENITVLKDEVKIDTGNKFIGSCLGHGVYLGSGCIVAPGRTIPGNLHITVEKDKIIRSISDSEQNVPGFQVIKTKPK